MLATVKTLQAPASDLRATCEGGGRWDQWLNAQTARRHERQVQIQGGYI